MAREIEQLRSMAQDYVPHYSDSEPEEPQKDSIPEPKNEDKPKYDMSKFSDADLEALKDIRGRAAPVKERRDIRERIDKEDISKLG